MGKLKYKQKGKFFGETLSVNITLPKVMAVISGILLAFGWWLCIDGIAHPKVALVNPPPSNVIPPQAQVANAQPNKVLNFIKGFIGNVGNRLGIGGPAQPNPPPQLPQIPSQPIQIRSKVSPWLILIPIWATVAFALMMAIPVSLIGGGDPMEEFEGDEAVSAKRAMLILFILLEIAAFGTSIAIYFGKYYGKGLEDIAWQAIAQPLGVGVILIR